MEEAQPKKRLHSSKSRCEACPGGGGLPRVLRPAQACSQRAAARLGACVPAAQMCWSLSVGL